MGSVVDSRRSYPSSALTALFAPTERWGWTLEVPLEFAPSALRCSPPIPQGGEDYALAYQRWREQIETEEADAIDRASTVATWSAQRPHHEYAMASVFGGTVIGWHALITTLGGSILGSGGKLTIVNLSERPVSASLRGLAKKCGYRVRLDTVAPAKCSFDLMSYVGNEQLIDFLVDVLHHDEEQPVTEAREDRAILRTVAGALNGKVTSERLQAALRVVLRESAPPGAHDVLTAQEYQHLSGLFGEARRDHTDLIARVARLDHDLTDFVALERGGRLAPPEPSSAIEDLRVLEALRTPNRLDFDFSVRLLIQAVARRAVRCAGASERHVFMIAGADQLNRRLIQSFSDLAEQGHVQFVMLFAHLREVTVDALGSGKAAVAFMRLTDHREAEEASRFIGNDKKFVVSQATVTRGQNYERALAHATNTDAGRSVSRGPDFGTTIGQSQSRSEGTTSTSSRGESFSASETEQRVDEPITEAHVFQSLPETGLLLVNLHTREPVFADCDPTLVVSPG